MGTTRLKKLTRKRVPTKPIKPGKKLLQLTKGNHRNKQHQNRKSSEKRMPARIMLRAGNVEYFLQPDIKLKIYERHKNNSVHRRPNNIKKREVDKRNIKHSQHGADKNIEVGKK
jgi:hypothetical protein